jgi:hypothetical protein
MANIRISQLPTGSAITGSELVPVVQNGQTIQTTVSSITNSPSQTQTFLTTTQEASLPNSRYIGGGLGIGTSNGGAQGLYSLFLNGTSASLENAATGLIVKSGVNTVVNRSIAAGTAGLSVANGDGIAGNPTLSLTNLALSISTLTGNGMVSLVNGSYFQNVTLTGAANQITILNPNGGSNPLISIADNPTLPGNSATLLPRGNTSQRISLPTTGMLRYNTQSEVFEGYTNTGWNAFSVTGGVTSFSAGTTGFTPISATTGAVTLAGILNVTNGGTGVGTLTGYVFGNGTSAMTASTTIPTTALSGVITNAQLQNSSVTYNGVTVSLGGSGTITATASNPLTIGNGLTGGSYDGSLAVTIAIDTSVVATLTGTQTLTNKSMSGSANTFTNLPNNALTNSSITLGSTTVSLGGTATSVTNLELITPTIASIVNTGTLTLPTSTDTLVGRATTDTFTNKSISGSTNTLTNIPNNALTNSSITLGTTNIALGATSLAPVGLTSVTVTQDPTTNLQLATKQYVDSIAASGIHYHEAVYVESPNTAGNLNATYASGGTSTTITTIASGTYVTFASGVPTIGSQVTTATANGLVSGTQYWVVAIVGGTVQLSLTYGGTAITGLTDGTGLAIASVINAGVNATLTNAGTQVALTIDGVLMTVGKRVLIYNQTDATQNGVYTVTVVGTASTNWVLTRASDANTYSPYSPYGLGQGDAFFVQAGATGAGETYVVSTTGSIFFGQTNITFVQISAAQVYSAGTGLTLTGTTFSITNTGVTNGSYGTASSVPTIAINSQGQITTASNTAIAIDGNQITSGTVGSAYISGSYTGITGVGTLTAGTWQATAIGAAYGGTGLTSYTAGDTIYATGSSTLVKLAIGTANQIMTSSGSAPQWVDGSTVTVGTATNANNVAITTGAATTNYLAFVTATSGNNPVLTNTNFTYNSSTNAITGGITGGTF